jgi:hypothetical protein
MAVALEEPVVRSRSASREGSHRLLWVTTALLILWQVGGHIDAWYHAHYGFQIESFFTWPHALLYAAWAATLVVVGGAIVLHRRAPRSTASLPPGFGVVFAGALLFGLGGVFDSLWHALFGFEVRFETLVTPAHLWLVTSYGIAIFGLLQAAAGFYREESVASARFSWAAIPVVVCFALLFRLMLWNLFYSEPFAIDYPTGGQGVSHFSNYSAVAFATDPARVAGVTGILLHTVLLALFLVVPLRRLHLPAGTIAAIMLWDGVLTAAVTDMWIYLPAVLGGVLVGEGIWAWMRRGGAGGVRAEPGYWTLGFAVPAAQFVLYFAIMAAFGGGIAWSVHLAAGTPVMAGFFGLVVAVLAVPPRFMRI